tara:strand:+ start:71 stop:607 length:537 start_codon:yes stop_codon:yes gene_type:complete
MGTEVKSNFTETEYKLITEFCQKNNIAKYRLVKQAVMGVILDERKLPKEEAKTPEKTLETALKILERMGKKKTNELTSVKKTRDALRRDGQHNPTYGKNTQTEDQAIQAIDLEREGKANQVMVLVLAIDNLRKVINKDWIIAEKHFKERNIKTRKSEMPNLEKEQEQVVKQMFSAEGT